MKDYRLSEVRDMCEECWERKRNCDECGVEGMCSSCFDELPYNWDDIEPRDMIELPCKVRFEDKMTGKTIIGWQVLSRKDGGYVGSDWFTKEEEADEFLQELKNGKVQGKI